MKTNLVCSILPPYILERLARSGDPDIRRRARRALAHAEGYRVARVEPVLPAPMRARRGKRRAVYDAGGKPQLPGRLVRSESQEPVADVAVNEAYDHSGTTYDFFAKIFGRNSLDGEGMKLVSSVHVGDEEGVPLTNAFWNGEQMAYGDGDGRIFRRFTRSLDVVGHELTHGVESFTSNLFYQGQSGALNEHFADVFGVLVRQWKRSEPASEASWVVGGEILVPAPTRRGIRDMEKPGTAFVNDPYLGTDPQPAHVKDYYTGRLDKGGVHLNSGIPNRAFALAAKAIGGRAWEIAGRIWYDALLQLSPVASFLDCARVTLSLARLHGDVAQKAVRQGWAAVGLSV
jgi:Zn-dependent metalloprotease